MRSKDCICFRHVYLTTWVLSCDWPETLVLPAVRCLWSQLLVLCVGSNCFLPCKWSFVEWPQWWGEVIIALIAFFSIFPVVWRCKFGGTSCSLRVCHCTPDQLLQSGLCPVADFQSPVSLDSDQLCNVMSAYYISHRDDYVESYSTGFPSSTAVQNYRDFIGITYKYLYTHVCLNILIIYKNNVTYILFT